MPQKSREKRLEYQRKWHKEHPNYQKELRQKNVEKIRERDRKHYQNNIEKERENNKKSYAKNKDTFNTNRRKVYNENPEKKKTILRKSKENYEKNKDTILAKNKAYAEINKEAIKEWNKEYGKEWYKKNKIKIKNQKKEYRERKPEVMLKAQIKHLSKLGLEFNLNAFQYKMTLRTWRKNIEKKIGKKCVICGSIKGLVAHHIFEKAKYPKLSFNENNGIMLCKKHHDEVHLYNLV
mgnify:CR=1 FL=1